MNEIGKGDDFSHAMESGDSDPLPECSGYEVAIANQQLLLAIDEAKITAAVQSILHHAGVSAAQVSIALVDDPTIHQLNVEFLEHDYPTDVLSFVLEQTDDSLEGELIVSTDTADREAREHDWPAEHELLLYVIHGALHLVGYLDAEPEERLQMLAAEKHFLGKFGVPVEDRHERWQELAGRDSSSSFEVPEL